MFNKQAQQGVFIKQALRRKQNNTSSNVYQTSTLSTRSDLVTRKKYHEPSTVVEIVEMGSATNAAVTLFQ